MDNNANRIILQNIARKAMIARGLEPDFPSAVDAELSKITSPAINKTSLAKDLRDKLWCSIDNADSLDLDQLTYAEQLAENKVRVFVAIADVDALVAEKSEIDDHASQNTSWDLFWVLFFFLAVVVVMQEEEGGMTKAESSHYVS